MSIDDVGRLQKGQLVELDPDLQNDHSLQELFCGAMEFLRLVGADRDMADSIQTSKVQQTICQHRVRRKELQGKKDDNGITRIPKISTLQRRKFERIKTPVTVFRKPKQIEGPSEAEQEVTVQKTLSYAQQLPTQEIFQPSPVPVVMFKEEEMNVFQNGGITYEDAGETSKDIQDCTYLSNEKDILVWKTLVKSPTNCNIFVGGLSPDFRSGMLWTAFEPFCVKEEDRTRLEAHVVMDVSRQRSKGYGFVTFPCRRSAEMAMICMQEFEILGKYLQLGWGQEGRENKQTGTENLVKMDSSKFNQTAHQRSVQRVEALGNSTGIKGSVVSDTCYCGEESTVFRQPLKRCSSRWDQETPNKIFRLQEPQNMRDSSLTIIAKENKTNGCSFEVCKPFGECVGLLGEVEADSKFQMPVGDLQLTASLKETAPAQDENITVVLSGKEKMDDYRTDKLSATNMILEGGQRNFVDVKVDSSILSEKQIEPSEQQKQFDGVLTNASSVKALIGLKRLSIGEDVIRTEAETRPVTPATTRSEHKPRRAVTWLTHEQKVSLLKSVCSRLREVGVRGHLGVFGVYYEADNSRLYVVCSKQIPESELQNEFGAFGVAEVKLNKDINGFSKGCAHIQFSDSKCAERAIKQLHGKVLGGLPIKVMVAEPKVRKGSRRKQSAS